MEPAFGIVCGECDLWSAPGTTACPACQHALALWEEAPAPPPEEPARESGLPVPETDWAAIAALEERSSQPPPAPTEDLGPEPQPEPVLELVPEPSPEPDRPSKPVLELVDEALLPTEPPPHSPAVPASGEEEMEQARSYICKSCHSQVPPGHKFCGRCGTPMPADVASAKTSFFGAMQTPGKAKLVLIRGEGLDGISYHLNSVEHLAGRSQGAILFPDDATLSPKHANFYYRDAKLFVRDEGSLNGVYARVRGSVPIEPSDVFMAGLQYFRLELVPKPADAPDPDGTYFYSSPKRASPFRVVHLLRGGATGMVYCARETSAQVGREGSDMNFPGDPYMSGKHAKIEVASGSKFTLTDLGSKNGTFLRIHRERELVHGDYVFLGRQLLRVEITP
jgi:pSer/pThr/pTyr-binding forkhead associated (FHA) protein